MGLYRVTVKKDPVREVSKEVFAAYHTAKKVATVQNDDFIRFLCTSLKNKTKQPRRSIKVKLVRLKFKRSKGYSEEREVAAENEVHKAIVEMKGKIVKKVRDQRKREKAFPAIQKSITLKGTSFHYPKAGGLMLLKGVNNDDRIYENPMHIFKTMLKRTSASECEESKRPINARRKYVGVEIEFMSPLSKPDVCAMLAEDGLSKYCHVKFDGSIKLSNGYADRHEIALMTSESEISDVIANISKTLNNKGAIDAGVNKTCGLHVHLDMRKERNLNKIWQKSFKWQDLLFAMNPMSRETGRFGKKNTSYNNGKFPTGFWERYSGVNPTSYSKYRTLEYRMHSGTTNAIKINNWIKLLQAIRNSGKIPKQDINVLTAESMREYLDLDDYLIGYILGRIKKFRPEEGNTNIYNSFNEKLETKLKRSVNSDIGDDNNYFSSTDKRIIESSRRGYDIINVYRSPFRYEYDRY